MDGFNSNAASRRSVRMNVLREGEVVPIEFNITMVPFRDNGANLLMLLLENTAARARTAVV